MDAALRKSGCAISMTIATMAVTRKIVLTPPPSRQPPTIRENPSPAYPISSSVADTAEGRSHWIDCFCLYCCCLYDLKYHHLSVVILLVTNITFLSFFFQCHVITFLLTELVFLHFGSAMEKQTAIMGRTRSIVRTEPAIIGSFNVLMIQGDSRLNECDRLHHYN